jgi:methylated-DNA-protein-cysteine methyltransferase-like protein
MSVQSKKENKDPSFFEDVWDVVRQVPKGRVTSYGAIAAYLGTKLSARMVGWAMNAVHSQPDIPAQRVVNRNGMLSGKAHFGEPDRMQKLLEKDGVTIENDTVKDFKTRFWDPKIELDL